MIEMSEILEISGAKEVLVQAVQHPDQNPDHAALSQLARDDPAAFEVVRQQLIGDLIGRAPEPIKRRLEGLQFRLDHVRRRSRTSLGATVKIYQMMWQSFMTLRHELINFRAPVTRQHGNAQVIEFRPRKLIQSL